jgi:hypothetical protein
MPGIRDREVPILIKYLQAGWGFPMAISEGSRDILVGKVRGGRVLAGGFQLDHPMAPRVLTWMAVLFVVVAVGRLGEIVPGLKVLPLVKILLGIALLALVANWKVLPRIEPSVGPAFNTARWLVLFILVSVPFSIWPGQSLPFLYTLLPVLVMAVLLMVKLSGHWSTLRTVLFSLVIAGSVLSLVALQGYVGGRIAVASMYDTNELAFVLVTLLPLTVAFGLVASTSAKKLLFFGLTAAFAASILLTSSRGGLIGLFASALVLILDRGQISSSAGGRSAKSRNRVVIPLIIALLAAAASWPLLPPETQERLASLVNLGSDYNADPNNDTGRMGIWTRGMTALGERPLGYGVAAYGMVDFRFGGRMLAPHSSLVQVAVELGVIAFALYLRLFWITRRGLKASLTGLRALQDPTMEHREQAVFCRALQACLVGCFASGLFLSMAYASVTWVTIGASLACTALVHRQIQHMGTNANDSGARR